ncbi:1-phosphofructokinase [Acidiphilium sp.]|uniref:1-phosphofructokinase n=1 Tax=Acidiphilium sp. TaxID=527 RepID=UPI003CFF8A9A
MSPVITLTLNPAIDETILLDRLSPGTVHRARSVAFHAGGKGVNVASCLADWGGIPVIAAGLLGRANEAPFARLFASKAIRDECLRVPGETRTNVKLAHAGETTDINLPGLEVTAESVRAVRERLLGLAAPGSVVLLAGSLPAGVDEGLYAELTASLAARGACVLLDSSGPPLARALAGGTPPWCIKPNRAELEALAGRRLPDAVTVRDAARGLLGRGVALVAVSLGAEGALFVTGEDCLHAALPPMRAASTVGAGDAMVAGIIAGIHAGEGIEGIARLGTAFAAAKLRAPGANLPERAVVEALAGAVIIQYEGVNAA